MFRIFVTNKCLKRRIEIGLNSKKILKNLERIEEKGSSENVLMRQLSGEDMVIDSFLIEDLVALEYKQAFIPIISKYLISENKYFSSLNSSTMEKSVLSIFSILEKNPDYVKNFKIIETSRYVGICLAF